VLYEIIRAAGEVDATQLHDRYDAVAERVYRGREQTPISRRSRRNKLRKLREYDLLESEGDSQQRVYSAVDRSIDSAIGVKGLTAGDP